MNVENKDILTPAILHIMLQKLFLSRLETIFATAEKQLHENLNSVQV